MILIVIKIVAMAIFALSFSQYLNKINKQHRKERLELLEQIDILRSQNMKLRQIIAHQETILEYKNRREE